jgi:4'-phosphopantetheinyl transferase
MIFDGNEPDGDVPAVGGAERIECRPELVHVISIRLDTPLGGDFDLLDRAERDRAASFVFDRDRRRFVRAHAWTRLALGSCLECPPDSLRLSVGPRGKPYLIDPPTDVRFNLSHSGERAVLAIALGQDVGVDIEEHRSVEVTELRDRYFAPQEVAAIASLPDTERLPAFFRCWTRKEAFIKALGDGLSFPLDGFEVSIAEEWSAQLLRGCRAAPEALERWRIVALRSEPGYSAALAASSTASRVRQWCAPQGPSGSSCADHPWLFAPLRTKR